MGYKYCNGCRKNKEKLAFSRNSSGKDGLRSICRVCSNKRNTAYNRYRGIKPIDDVYACSSAIGRDSENIVKQLFISHGYKVEMSNGKGPDLICSNGRYSFTVEVKTVMKNKKWNHYYVGKVREKRLNDNYIACVFNKKVIWVEALKDFLGSHTKGLTVTNIVNNQKPGLTHLASK